MTETRRCPGCGSEVVVPEGLGRMAVGCNNVDQHDDEERLVMWPEVNHD